jgi:hypothetical protein
VRLASAVAITVLHERIDNMHDKVPMPYGSALIVPLMLVTSTGQLLSPILISPVSDWGVIDEGFTIVTPRLG